MINIPDWQKRALVLWKQCRCGRVSLGKMLAREGFHVSDRTLGRWMKKNNLRGDQQGYDEVTKMPDTGGGEIQTEYGQKDGNVVTRSPHIRTLDDALAAADVNLETWEVDRYIINSWGMTNSEGEAYTNYQVKVWLKRLIEEPQQKALESLVSRLENKPLSPPTISRNPKHNPHLLEISLYDHHFGKLAWGKETGNDYDLQIAEQLFSAAIENLLGKVNGYAIEKILLPIGQDFLHVNNQQATTAKGTRQDVDTRLAKIFEAAMMAVVNAVERARQVAPVEIIWIPGNHDSETSYYLAQVIRAYYRTCQDVAVNSEPTARKYLKYGNTRLGFTHGDKEPLKQLPIIMAGSEPQAWAETKHREWHIGHLHKKKEVEFITCDSEGPVRVRQLPSLCGTDAWHFESGYVNGLRAAEGYLWHKEYGYAGHFSAGICELEKALRAA